MTMPNISLKRKPEVNLYDDDEERSPKRAKVDEETQAVVQGVLGLNNSSSSNNSQSSSNTPYLNQNMLNEPGFSFVPNAIFTPMDYQSSSSSNSNGNSGNQPALPNTTNHIEELIDKIAQMLNNFNPKNEELKKNIDNLLKEAINLAPENQFPDENVQIKMLLADFKFKMGKPNEGLEIYFSFVNRFEKDSIKYFQQVKLVVKKIINNYPAIQTIYLCNALVKDAVQPASKAFCHLIYAQAIVALMNSQKTLEVQMKKIEDALEHLEKVSGQVQEIPNDKKEYIYTLFLETFETVFVFASHHLTSENPRSRYALFCFKYLSEILLSIQDQELKKFLLKRTHELFDKMFGAINKVKKCVVAAEIFSNLALFFDNVDMIKIDKAKLIFWCAQIKRTAYEETEAPYDFCDYENDVLKPFLTCCNLLEQEMPQNFLAECLTHLCYALNYYCYLLKEGKKVELKEYQNLARQKCVLLMGERFKDVYLQNGKPATVQGAYALLNYLENNGIKDENLKNQCLYIILKTVGEGWNKLPQTKKFWTNLISLTKNYDMSLADSLEGISRNVKFELEK